MAERVGEIMASIEIDGKTLEVEPGSMIIEAADDAGIYIPRFCYHKKLSVAANCRMCLVDVEKSGKPLPACATPVADGMKISTCSQKALAVQRQVMEFLLINHPLDCPICDQGGQCELQDISMGFGQDFSSYEQTKRAVEDKDIGPLVATEMTRCIHCTRCVRFGTEVAGIPELGVTGRGENSRIGTYVEKAVASELSGNIIDLCPVGALTSKPFRFQARAWELQQHESIAPHDCLGSNIYAHCRREEVLRVVPRENAAVNEVWLSDRDRFSYTGLVSDDRARQPMLKRDGQLVDVDWEEALLAVVAGLSRVKTQHGNSQVGVIAGAQSTTEEYYLLQKLMRDLEIDNLDHRVRQTDFSDQDRLPVFPQLGMSIEALAQRDAVLLVGSHLRHEQPLACQRLRQGALAGHRVISLNPMSFDLSFTPHADHCVPMSQIPYVLAGVAHALLSRQGKTMPAALQNVALLDAHNDMVQDIVETLLAAQSCAIVLGHFANNHPQAAWIRALVDTITTALADVVAGTLSDGANAAGACLAGMLPHRLVAGATATSAGRNAADMFEQLLNAYVLLNVEPELDAANTKQALRALHAAEFVVVLTPFVSDEMRQYADVILPIAAFAETPGTFVNATGTWQSFQAVTLPQGEARPAWKVLRVLGNLFGLPEFTYQTAQEVLTELQRNIVATTVTPAAVAFPDAPLSGEHSLNRLTEWPIYRSDMLVRRAPDLQATGLGAAPAIYVNANMAASLNLVANTKVSVQQAGGQAELMVQIDARVPDNTLFIPAGYKETVSLGSAFGPIAIV